MPGEKVIAQHASLAGDYTVEAHPAGCSLVVRLTGGTETDVTFTGAAQECLELAGTHEAGAMPHPFFGALSLTVTGAGGTQPVVELSSMDSPPNPGLGIIGADETGSYFVTELPPGRYQVQVHDAKGKLATESFVIGTGAESTVDLSIDISDRY